MTRPTTLESGRAAFAAHDWEQAWDALHAADAGAQLGAEDLERLADAARWTGRYDELVATLERAHATYQREGDARGAARVALTLARYHYEHNRAAASNGWWMRAHRALDGIPDCREHGLLQWMYAHACFEHGDLDDALAAAVAVADAGRRLHEPDLEALGLHDQGHVLIARGDVEAGLALVDEAMTVAMSSTVGLMVTGTVYCGTIWACRNVGDWRRASEWTDLSLQWCERESVTRFPGLCRFHRAEVMRLRGSYEAAERDAADAAEELLVTAPRNAGWALGELGEIRRRRGDDAGAADAFRQAVALGYDPQPGIALLRLDRGDAPGALRSLRRALADPAGLSSEARTSLLPAAVRVAIEAGDLDAARALHADLERAAQACGTVIFLAGELEARGRLALATGDVELATVALRDAARMLGELEAPYEMAQARVALAQAYLVSGDHEGAEVELATARATFDRLGARTEAARLDPSPRTAHAVRTFVFTDIIDSTKLVEFLGDDAWGDLLAWHDRTFRAAFAAYGGEEVSHGGDGFFVAFAAPAPALDCAVALQQALRRQRQEHGFAPNVRIGVHAGDALDRGGNYGGREVHVAARVAALAGADEILVTASTAAAAPGRVTSGPRPVALKGVTEPVDIVTLDWR